MKQALLFFLYGLCLLMPVSISANAVPKHPVRALPSLGVQSTIFNKKKIKPRPKKSFIHQQKSRSKRVRKRPATLSPVAANSLLFIGLLLFVAETVLAWIFLFGNVALWLALGMAIGTGVWGLLMSLFVVSQLDNSAWNNSALFVVSLLFF